MVGQRAAAGAPRQRVSGAELIPCGGRGDAADARPQRERRRPRGRRVCEGWAYHSLMDETHEKPTHLSGECSIWRADTNRDDKLGCLADGWRVEVESLPDIFDAALDDSGVIALSGFNAGAYLVDRSIGSNPESY